MGLIKQVVLLTSSSIYLNPAYISPDPLLRSLFCPGLFNVKFGGGQWRLRTYFMEYYLPIEFTIGMNEKSDLSRLLKLIGHSYHIHIQTFTVQTLLTFLNDKVAEPEDFHFLSFSHLVLHYNPLHKSIPTSRKSH